MRKKSNSSVLCNNLIIKSVFQFYNLTISIYPVLEFILGAVKKFIDVLLRIFWKL